MPDFHEVLFPLSIALGSTGGPERRTIVSTAGSGFEHRNSQWADSKRRFNAGTGLKTDQDIYTLVDFFEERRGKLIGFRWRDRRDCRSKGPRESVLFTDQVIGTGTGALTTFQLKKQYGKIFNPYTRNIKKPVAGTVKVGVNGVQVSNWTVDTTTGIITFAAAPANGASITAGFEFDVPVRFDTDMLEINLSAFDAGEVPDVPVVEIKL